MLKINCWKRPLLKLVLGIFIVSCFLLLFLNIYTDKVDTVKYNIVKTNGKDGKLNDDDTGQNVVDMIRGRDGMEGEMQTGMGIIDETMRRGMGKRIEGKMAKSTAREIRIKLHKENDRGDMTLPESKGGKTEKFGNLPINITAALKFIQNDMNEENHDTTEESTFDIYETYDVDNATQSTETTQSTENSTISYELYVVNKFSNKNGKNSYKNSNNNSSNSSETSNKVNVDQNRNKKIIENTPKLFGHRASIKTQGAVEKQKKCKAQHHVIFLKIHKAGSSTVANVMFRYGVRNHLTLLLPHEVHVASRQNTPWVDILPPPRGKKYDLLTSHSIHNPSEWRRLMPGDSVKVAILREPLSHLNSAIYYFAFKKVPGENKLVTFLNDPERYNTRKGRPALLNAMSYELGVSKNLFHEFNYIKQYAPQLNKTYSLMMIMELMDESLVLLRRLLCWSTRDIVYIIRNVSKRKPTDNIYSQTSQKLKNRHREIATADYYLYDFFRKELLSKIENAGQDFKDEVKQFKFILKLVKQYCDREDDKNKILEIEATKWNEEFYVTDMECKKMNMSGLGALRWVKRKQYKMVNTKAILKKYSKK